MQGSPPCANTPYQLMENIHEELVFFNTPALKFPNEGKIGLHDYSVNCNRIADVSKLNVYHLRDDPNNQLWFKSPLVDFYLQW